MNLHKCAIFLVVSTFGTMVCQSATSRRLADRDCMETNTWLDPRGIYNFGHLPYLCISSATMVEKGTTLGLNQSPTFRMGDLIILCAMLM